MLAPLHPLYISLGITYMQSIFQRFFTLLELQKEVLMQMRTTLRLPKIHYVCLFLGHNTLCSEFLSFIPPSHTSNTTHFENTTVRLHSKTEIKDQRDMRQTL